MPARKHREGADLHNWQDRKDQHALRVAMARESVKSLSGHTLLRLDEAAATLNVLREFARMTGKEFRSLLDERLIRLSLMEQRLAEVEARLAEAEARL